MAPLLQVIAIAQLLITGIVIAHQERKYDCSAITETAPLDTYKDVCHQVADWRDETLQLSVINKLDVIETCTCHLLRHTLAWQAMITHEVETMYYVIRKLVQEKVSGDELKVDDNNILLRYDEDDHMYFWDRLKALLRVQGNGRDELSWAILEAFAQVYYNPDSYQRPFVDKRISMNQRRVHATSCNQLLTQFGPFLTYFNNLKRLSENPRFVYRIVSYDEALYKIVSVMKVCEFLVSAGELVN